MAKAIAITLIVILGTASIACTTTTTRSGKALTASPTLSSADRKKNKQEAIDTYIKLGMGYLREGNREGARMHLQKSLELKPRSAAAHNGMALLYQLEKENELAEKYYLDALKYDSDFTAGRNNYAVFLMRNGRYEEAYKHLLIAADDLEYPRRGRVYLSLGQAASHLGKTDEAVAAWDRSININPNMSPSYVELARVYLARNDLPRAKRYLERYDALVGPRAEALWLGVELEDAFHNDDGVASKGLALEKMFPYSQQNLDYQKWKKDQSWSNGETAK